MIGATVEIADFEEFKTPQIAWILLRTFVDDHEIARHAWKSSGLRPNIFQYCGFGGASIYEFLKVLCTTDQPPDITELRQMFPGYFPVHEAWIQSPDRSIRAPARESIGASSGCMTQRPAWIVVASAALEEHCHNRDVLVRNRHADRVFGTAKRLFRL